jgi:flap endonuclease-1
MGIKGLNKLIKYINRCQPDKTQSLSSYSGSKIAIDTEGLLYKFRHASEKQTTYEKKRYHIYAIVLHAIKFLNENIIPIYVFDGKPPEAKYENCLEKRYNEREKNLKKFLEIESIFLKMIENNNESIITDPSIIKILEEYESAQNRCIFVNKIQRQECMNILHLLGIPYINVNAEAECVCVYLAKHKIVDYVLSEDTDCIVYGISSLESNDHDNLNDHDIKILKKTQEDTYIELSCRHIIQSFKMTIDQFIDMCILCGCDYCHYTLFHCNSNIKLGPNACYKLIRDFKSIDNILYLFKGDFNYIEARNIFRNGSNNLKVDVNNDFITLNLQSLLEKLHVYVSSNKMFHNQ